MRYTPTLPMPSTVLTPTRLARTGHLRASLTPREPIIGLELHAGIASDAPTDGAMSRWLAAELDLVPGHGRANALRAGRYLRRRQLQVRYVEGYAVTPEGFPLEHAWLATERSVIDPTPAWVPAPGATSAPTRYYPAFSVDPLAVAAWRRSFT